MGQQEGQKMTRDSKMYVSEPEWTHFLKTDEKWKESISKDFKILSKSLNEFKVNVSDKYGDLNCSEHSTRMELIKIEALDAANAVYLKLETFSESLQNKIEKRISNFMLKTLAGVLSIVGAGVVGIIIATYQIILPKIQLALNLQ